MCYYDANGTYIVCGTINMYAVSWKGDCDVTWGAGMAVVLAWDEEDAVELVVNSYGEHSVIVDEITLLKGQVPGHRGVVVENGWFE